MIKVCDYGLDLEACILALASLLANVVFITEWNWMAESGHCLVT